MPADQRGHVYATSNGYGIRWYDEHGTRRRRAGFKSRSAARSWFENVEKRRMRCEEVAPEPTTLSEHVARYLEAHAVGRDPKTIDVLRFRLGYATRTFGELRLDEFERRVAEVAGWTRTLPEGSRHGIVQALRQALDAGIRWGQMTSNPAKLAGRNPQPRREEVKPFEPEEVERIAEELGSVYGPLVVVAAYTGLRPSEWVALEWRDVDRTAGVVTIERAFSYGQLKAPKTKGSRRRVPLPARATEALETLPRRLDSRLVFPGPRGAHIDLRNWRKREWQPALEAAGLWTRPPKGQPAVVPCPRPYDLRHSYASWMLAAGVPAYDVARYMGTSVRMLDLTYGHLVKGSESAARDRLDTFTAGARDGLGQESATT
jgi:integrase